MRKIFALCINELTKISKRISVLILLIIMVVAVFGLGGLLKYQESKTSDNDIYKINEEFLKEEKVKEIESCKSQIADLEKSKLNSDDLDDSDRANIENQLLDLNNRIDMYQYAEDNKIKLTGGNDYLQTSVYKLYQYKLVEAKSKNNSTSKMSPDESESLTNAKNFIPRLEKVISNKNYDEYIDILKEEINLDKFSSSDEKKINLEIVQIESKLHSKIENKSESYKLSALQYVEKIRLGKLSLLYNFDQTSGDSESKPLTIESEEKIKNDISINEYRVENEIFQKVNVMLPNVFDTLIGFGIFIILILMMILAGGSVSSEMSTGSIKSLIISPTKRWKIFFAKVLSLLTMLMFSMTLLYFVTIIANGIFFGFSSGNPYIYIDNGTVHTINFYLYQFLRLLAQIAPVFLITAFAFMLSIITRNTAVSVGISISIYLSGSIANNIMLQFFQGEWQKFNPFNNLDISTKLFPNDTSVGSMQQLTQVNNSLTFTSIYLTILVFCLLYVGLDSFNRRDIK